MPFENDDITCCGCYLVSDRISRAIHPTTLQSLLKQFDQFDREGSVVAALQCNDIAVSRARSYRVDVRSVAAAALLSCRY